MDYRVSQVLKVNELLAKQVSKVLMVNQVFQAHQVYQVLVVNVAYQVATVKKPYLTKISIFRIFSSSSSQDSQAHPVNE